MGRVNLTNDIAWDTGVMSEFKNDSSEVLRRAEGYTRDIEGILSSVLSTYNSVPAEYRHPGLGQALSETVGRMSTGVFDSAGKEISDAVDSVVQGAVSADHMAAEELRTVKHDLAVIRAKAEVIGQTLTAPGIKESFQDIIDKIKKLAVEWENKGDGTGSTGGDTEKTKLGSPEGVEFSADPVNMATGNFIYDHADLKINGDIPLEFHRYYNSMDRAKGVLGRCFSHNYSIRLEKEEDTVRICMQDGQRKLYRMNKEGRFTGYGDAKEVLTYESGRYVLTSLNGYRWIFDETGKLTRQENRFNRGISFTYHEEGETGDLLKKAEADNGCYLLYTYEDGYLTKVSDNAGRCVCLTYRKNKLDTVTTAKGSVYTYKYGESGRITEVTNARNVTAVKNKYDEKNRVTRQDFPDGGSMHFDYDDGERLIILTERNGAVIKYVHDTSYRNTDVIYEDGTREHTEYNDRNQKVAVTDRNGNTTRMAYDDKGNLTQHVNAAGVKTNFTYNASNRLLAVKVNGREIIKNSYDGRGRLLSSVNAEGGVLTYEYNENGKPVSVTDADDGETKIYYDERQNIIKVTDPSGASNSYTYDELNRVVETVDGNGNKTGFMYDEADRIVKSVNAKGETRLFAYNAGGMLTEVTDYDGYKASAEYNAVGRISKVTDKEGNSTEYIYDKMWNIEQIVYVNKGIIKNTYNKDNRLESVRLQEGGLVCYTYDANGNRISVTDPEGNTTRFFYDKLNRVVKVADASGAESTVEYDEYGNVSREVNALGACMEYRYNGLGKCTEKKDSKGAVHTYEYDRSGRLVKTTYPNGSTVTREYKAGKLSRIVKPDGTFNAYEYDNNGNCVSVTDSEGRVTTMEYDELNNLTRVTNPAGSAVNYKYDRMGNIVEVCDALGHKTGYTYTPNGKPAGVVDAAGEETRHEYDCMGNLVRVLRTEKNSGRVQETAYERNLEGKVTKVTDALGNVETFAYDRCGRIVSKCDRDGYSTKYGYDARGLMTSMEYADGTGVMLSFDPLRKLQEIKDSTGTTKIENDEYGRILSVTDGTGKTVGYEWGSMNERLATIYPDGRKAVYSYDGAGRLAGLETARGTVSYSYDSLGRLASKKLPNEAVTEYLYNETGRVTGITHKGADFTESCSYTYDAVGNKISADRHGTGMADYNGKYSYAYDELNRLTEVSKDGNVLRKYGYDAFGNRSHKEDYGNSVSGIRTTYSYNGNNQLTSRVTDGMEESYSYDKRGNLVSVANGTDVIRSFVFDAANRMTEAKSYNGSEVKTAAYTYNGAGHRAGQSITVTDPEKDVINELTKQISYTTDLTKGYHNLLSMEENDSVKDFYWDTNVVSMEEAGTESYYIQDDLGSPMGLMDGSGNIRSTYAFDEFGVSLTDEEMDEHEKSLQPFGYTGYQRDEVSGLYFAQARRYDAWNGRFVSKDSDKFIKITRPDSFNQYLYCDNNPEKYIDPSGNKYYIFTITGDDAVWDAARNMKYMLEHEYDYEIEIVEINNGESFESKFNEIVDKDTDIDGIIIHTHGNQSGLYQTEDASTSILDISEINKLNKNARIGFIIITACDTAGNQDSGEENFAKKLSEYYLHTYIVAANGPVITLIDDIYCIDEFLDGEKIKNSEGKERDPRYIGFYLFNGLLEPEFLGNQNDDMYWTISSLTSIVTDKVMGDEMSGDFDSIIKKIKYYIQEILNENSKKCGE